MTARIGLDMKGETAVVTCTGDLDLECAQDLRRTIGAATRSGALTIVVDVSAAALVDSTTLGVLLHANTACREAGSTLVVAGASRSVARSIALTGLDRVLTLASDIDAGLAIGLPSAADV
jgi:anti-anti-sigma factor